MVLFGIYKNGKIKILGDKLPKVQANFEIRLLEQTEKQKRKKEALRFYFSKGKLLIADLRRENIYEDRI